MPIKLTRIVRSICCTHYSNVVMDEGIDFSGAYFPLTDAQAIRKKDKTFLPDTQNYRDEDTRATNHEKISARFFWEVMVGP